MSLINFHPIIFLQFGLLVVVLVCEATPPPNIKSCCRGHGVDEFCVRMMCNVEKAPHVDQAFHGVTQWCGLHLPAITACLADGRNHTSCCHKEAEDPIQSICFDFCDASAKSLENKPWQHQIDYVLCLSMNKDAIYRCFRNGYKASPGPPKFPTVVSREREAEIRWQPPNICPPFANKYVVFYGRMGDKYELLRNKTELLSLTLGNLQPDTNYYFYVVASNVNNGHQSLPSNKVNFKTKGARPTIRPYRRNVSGPRGSVQIMVCLINVTGVKPKRLQVMWQKQNERGRYEELHHTAGSTRYRPYPYPYPYREAFAPRSYSKYSFAFHKLTNSFQQPLSYVSALIISNVTYSDYGSFRCAAKNDFGMAWTALRFRRRFQMRMPSSPPNLTACCERAGVQPQCMNLMEMNQSRCAADFPKLLICALRGLKQGACCLRNRVPQHCLPMCDVREQPDVGATFSSCQRYTTNIFRCRVAAMAYLPSRPTLLVVSNVTASSIEVRWVGSGLTDNYHVFYRRADNSIEKWQRQTTLVILVLVFVYTPPTVRSKHKNKNHKSVYSRQNAFQLPKRKTTAEEQMKLSGLQPNLTYEVVVVATNSYGDSAASETKRVTTEKQVNFTTNGVRPTSRLDAVVQLPSRPSLLAVSNVTASSFDVRWVDSERAYYYVVYYRHVDNEEWQWKMPMTAAGVQTATLADLQPNLTYEVAVVAKNRYGSSEASESKRVTTESLSELVDTTTTSYDDSEASETKRVTTGIRPTNWLEAMVQPPSRPSSLVVSKVTSNSIDVHHEGSERADYYVVYHRRVEEFQWNKEWQMTMTTADVQTTRLSELQPNVVYDVAVVALNSFSSSEASETIRVTTARTNATVHATTTHDINADRD